MKTFALRGLAGLVFLMCLGAGSLYWLTRPANINWHSRTRDGLLDLRAVDWDGKNLAGANLAEIWFRESSLRGANLRRTNLQGSDFSGATYLDDADLSHANLTRAKLGGTYARRANFTGAILKDADLQYATLSGANLSGVDFAGADLSYANLVGAKLTNWINAPKSLDRADLTKADWPQNITRTSLCNTIMPDGNTSKQGCFWPTPGLKKILHSKDWHGIDSYTSGLFRAAISGGYAVEQLSAEIEQIPCQDLKVLNDLWHQASEGKFSFSQQRQIWENPPVQQNYGKFADVVGWKQNGQWIKYEELQLQDVTLNNRVSGHLPWHRWQVQEPTEAEPTRFRRIGFGAWMARLKQCDI
ncbi:pentapeptide repeat-containing protein [Leptothoe spongobia]|uniref:Pentapeptide repeat-containing protein n=1 Tax=Leptothoe spongobia TAU-MAC 1115 TaxID=1967444 RepID=A0A947DF69_9CYAN|nr:pentapeptide repeat-containing protein [Leptothoe spongobia]MBT9315544.1 pentapeptide repeat-containing protein [Leptothoe spongobia TAU-MAC 1115]